MKITHILLSFTLSLSIVACNSSSKQEDSTSQSNEKISVPKRVGLSIPKSLQKSSTVNTTQKSLEKPISTSSSLGYMQLLDSVNELSFTKKNIEIELLVISHLMDDIIQYCANTAIDTTCTIPKGELTLTFNNELVSEIKEIDPNITGLEGQTQTLDKIEFTQYNNTKPFQYAFKIYEDNATHNSSIEWSKDEKNIRSSYKEYQNSKLAFSSTINYNEFSSTNKKMTINDSSLNARGETEEFHFTITDKGNKEYTISANENSEFGKFSSLGEVSKEGGYLLFSGEFDGEKFSEKETFDANGNLLSSSFCNSTISCSFDDPTTWQISGVENSNLEESFDIEGSMMSLEDYEYTPLTVTGGKLHGKLYFLLAPSLLPQDIGIEQMSTPMIERASVGDIYNLNGEISASLYNKKYIESLNELIVVEVIFPNNDTNVTNSSSYVDPIYKLVSKTDTPTLTVDISSETKLPLEDNPQYFTTCVEEYQPVCASVDVQCIAEECEVVEQTFGNRCELDNTPEVTYLRDGEC